MNHQGRGVRGLTTEASPQSAVASRARSGPRASPGQHLVQAGSTNIPADRMCVTQCSSTMELEGAEEPQQAEASGAAEGPLGRSPCSPEFGRSGGGAGSTGALV